VTAKRVLVTGAARGLGAVITETLTERGWQVWAADVDPAGGSSQHAHRTLTLDVTDAASITQAFAEIDAEGGLHAVVNNAGVYPNQAWDELDAATMQRVFSVNVFGTTAVAQAAAKSMIAHGIPGTIVNVVSLAFFKGAPTAIAYAASKGAVIGLTRSLAKAVGQYGIRVNAIAPGLMATDGTLALVAEGSFPADRLTGIDPDRQLPGATLPVDVARALAALLSDDLRDVTGQILTVDGGTYFV
jgi:NAD(P)-dependent dehydrogenase (short-subunit alcohol dehydrogenase family)